jgi:hypothetical protein
MNKVIRDAKNARKEKILKRQAHETLKHFKQR